VVRDLPAAVAAHHGDVAGVDDVLVAAGDALREHRRMLAEPDLVDGALVARRRQRAHRVERQVVRDRAEHLDDHRPARRPSALRARP
jgi:hypothetical protein